MPPKKKSFGFVNGSTELDVVDLKAENGAGHGAMSSFSANSISSYDNNDEQNPRQSHTLNCGDGTDVLLTGIFGVEDKSYDVTLHPSSIELSVIGGKMKSSATRRTSVKKIEGDKMVIWIKDLFGANLCRHKPKSSKGLGACQGVQLHTFSEKDASRLKHKTIFLNHPSESVCTKWLYELTRILKTITGRPRSAKCYMDVESSMKSEFVSKIRPILEAAQLEVNELEGCDPLRIAKDIESMDLSRYDCILVAGGDAVVNTVADGLLRKAQFDNGIVLGGRENLHPSSVPLGVIPAGCSNIIAHTVHGTSDMVTAALDIVYGRTLMSDVLSVSQSQGGFYKFAFSAHYGFGGTVMELMSKARFAQSNYQLAIAKGLTKSKLRAYSCEVKYKLAPPNLGDPSDGRVCRAGCTVCNNDSVTPCPDGSKYSDPLQDFDPLDASSTSSQLSEIGVRDCQSHTIKGEFYNVSLFATASACDMAPLGLSKYSHIADGCMDLVLVSSTDRKDLMRFLKRNGNSKNQLDFPFVESHRVKEVSFHVRMPVGWSYRDKDYNEINDQARQQKSRQTLAAADEPIRVVGNEDSTDITDLNLDDSDSDDEGSVPSKPSSSTTRSLSGDHGSLSSTKDENAGSECVPPGHVHIIHKYTETDRRLKKRNVKDLEKEMKAKAKEEKAIKSLWNLDWTLCSDTDLTFRVHQKMMMFYGSGMAVNTAEEEDVFCFPAI